LYVYALIDASNAFFNGPAMYSLNVNFDFVFPTHRDDS